MLKEITAVSYITTTDVGPRSLIIRITGSEEGVGAVIDKDELTLSCADAKAQHAHKTIIMRKKIFGQTLKAISSGTLIVMNLESEKIEFDVLA